MKSRSISVLLSLVVVMSLVPLAMAAGYELSASETTPLPEQTVDVKGQSHTVDSMVRVSPGDIVSLDVNAPDEVYRVYLYNSDKQIVVDERGEGDESFSFDLSGYEPGTYIVATHHDGDYTAVQPVLVSGYDVSVDAPTAVGSDESVDVTIDVAATAADSSPNNVNVIVAQDGTTTKIAASESGGEYTATIESNELDAGEYTVYGVVQSDGVAFGQQGLMGLSDGHSLTIEPDSGSTADSTSDSESTDNSASSTTETNSLDTEPDEGYDGGAESPATESANAAETTPVTESPTATASEMATPTETNDGVITPGGNTTPESTAANGPGFTTVSAIGAIALVVLLGRRRS